MITPDDLGKAFFTRWQSIATVSTLLPGGLWRDGAYVFAGGDSETNPGAYAVYSVEQQGDEEIFGGCSRYLARWGINVACYADQNKPVKANDVAMLVLPMNNWLPQLWDLREGSVVQVIQGNVSSRFDPQKRNANDVNVLRFRLNLQVQGNRLTA